MSRRRKVFLLLGAVAALLLALIIPAFQITLTEPGSPERRQTSTTLRLLRNALVSYHHTLSPLADMAATTNFSFIKAQPTPELTPATDGSILDGWGRPIRLHSDQIQRVLISAGPDGNYETNDTVTPFTYRFRDSPGRSVTQASIPTLPASSTSAAAHESD